MNVNNSTEREKTDSPPEHPGPHVIPGARSSKTALGIISTPLIWPVRKKQDPVTHSQERPVIYMTKPEIVVTQNMPAVAAKHNVTVRKHVQQGTKNGSYDTTADFPKETFLRQHKNNESDRVEPLQTTSLSSRKNKQNAPYWDLQDTGENNTLNQTEPLDYSSGSEPAVYEVDIRGGMFNGTDASAAFSSYEMDSSFILHDTVPLNRSGNTAQYNITEENNNLMNVTRITDSQSQSFYHFPSDLPLQGSLVTYSSITEINLFSSLLQQTIVDNVLLPLSVTGKQTVHLNFTSAQQTVPSVPPVSRDTYLQSPRVSIRPTKPVLLSEYNGNIFSLPGITSDYQHITPVTTTTAEATEPVKDELNPQSLSSNFMNSTFLPPNRDISSSRKEPVHNLFSFTSNNEQADSHYRVFPSNPIIPPSQMPTQQFNEIPKTDVKASSEIQSKILMLEPSRLGNSLQSHVFEVYSSMTYAYLATHSQFFATFISGTPSNLIVSDSTQSYTINNQFVENIPRSAIPIENLSLTTLVGMSSKSSISLNTAAPLMYMSLLSTTEKITSFHSSHLYLFSQSSEGRLDKSASYITYVSNSKTDLLPVDSVLQGKGLMISKPVSEGADYFNIVPQSWTFLNSSSTHVSDGTYLSRIYPLPKIKEHFTLSHSIHKTTFTGYLSASNLELEKYMSPSSALYSTNDFQQKPFNMLHTINVSSQEKREYHMSAFRDFNKSDVYLKVSSPSKVFLPEFYSSTTMPHSVSPEPANTFNLKPVQTETLNLKEAHSALAYLTPLLLESPQLVTDKEPGTTKPSIIPRTVTTFFKDTVKNITHGWESVNTNLKDWTARTSVFPTIVKETSILHVDSVSQHSQIRNSSDSSRYDGSSSVSGADARSPLEDSTIAESSTNNFTLPSTQHPVSTINVSANTVIGNISHAANPHTIQTVLLSHTESKPTTGYPTKDPHTLIPPNRTSEAFAGGVHTISATGSLTAVGLTAFSSCQCKVRFDITCQCGFTPNNSMF